MYQLKIQKNINKVKEYPTYDKNGNELKPEVLKTKQEIADEKQGFIDAKKNEIQTKIDAYEAAKLNQRQNGGPGPVADFEIMKICNQYSGEFEVIIEE